MVISAQEPQGRGSALRQQLLLTVHVPLSTRNAHDVLLRLPHHRLPGAGQAARPCTHGSSGEGLCPSTLRAVLNGLYLGASSTPDRGSLDTEIWDLN